MININIDEAVAFDMLSIAAVKADRTNDEFALTSYSNFCDQIKSVIGSKKFEDLLKSEKYLALYQVNSEIWDMVDWIKKTCKKNDPALLIDSLNYDRWKLKKELQKMWFNTEITETKYGY
jgi:hypothetical protein